MAKHPCPCGSGDIEAACCGPILEGLPAPTALALMRSRYTAFVRGAFAYLVETDRTAKPPDAKSLAASTRGVSWTGLEIIDTALGGEPDDTGEVEFIARGKTKAGPFAQRERSQFRRDDGRWYYVSGTPKPA